MRDGFSFVLGGLRYGLARQTHLGTLVLVPALVATFLLALRRDRAWSRRMATARGRSSMSC
jgi:hypothetical protein